VSFSFCSKALDNS